MANKVQQFFLKPFIQKYFMAINAQESIQDNGLITIETLNVTFDKNTLHSKSKLKIGNYIAIIVKDTGCGIPNF